MGGWCRSTLPPAPDARDPPGLRAQVMQLFEAFVRLLDEAPAERQHTQFVLQLRELDLLKVSTLSLAPIMSPQRVTKRQSSKDGHYSFQLLRQRMPAELELQSESDNIHRWPLLCVADQYMVNGRWNFGDVGF